MRINNLLLGGVLLAVGFLSCTNEADLKAKVTVLSFMLYVDSITKITDAQAQANWAAIESGFKKRTAEIDAVLVNVTDKKKLSFEHQTNQEIAMFKMKKDRIIKKIEAVEAVEKKNQNLRDNYFGVGKVKEDLNLDCVNKDNILAVYKQFITVFKTNKDNYSRQEFNKIKAMYAALDARKFALEQQGLSSKSNMEISKLKERFAEDFQWNRLRKKAVGIAK